MADVKITALPTGVATATSIVPVVNEVGIPEGF